MNIKRFLLFSMIAVIAISLSGCFKPASTAPAATSTTGGGFPVPGTETMGLFETIATQTALAAAGGGGPAPTSEQPLQPQPTAKPTKAPKASPTAKPAAAEQATATLAPINVPKATPGRPAKYTLENGEFPYCIARRFNVNPNDLLSINGLSSGSTTYAGMTLKIPQDSKFPGTRSLHNHPATYTVKANDTIYSVACYFGDVDPLVLAQVNNLDKPYKLSSGQTLQIP